MSRPQRASQVSNKSHDVDVCCYHTLASAAGLRVDIDALNLESVRPDPFSTFEFLESFLAHDESGTPTRSTLWLLTASRAGRLIGYAALSRTRKSLVGLQCSTIGFAVTHDTDRPHVVARVDDIGAVTDAFFQYLLGRKREWALLEFQQQDETSSLFGILSGGARDGLAVRQWPSLANGTIHLRWRTFPEYLRSLPKRNRSNAGRQVRNLLAAGEVEVLASSDPGATPAMLELYRSVEPRSWKFAANATIGRHPSRIAYFQALLRPTQPMRVAIQLLLLDGIPVAGLITGSFLDGLYALHIIYDANLTALAPGSLMLLMGIRHAIERRAATFNLLSGFGYFKVRWLATMTEARAVQVYRTDTPPFWHRLVGDAIRWALRATARTVPSLFNPARRAALVPGADPTEPVFAPLARVGAEERVRLGALLVQARQGQTETTSAVALRALWPGGPATAAPTAATLRADSGRTAE